MGGMATRKTVFAAAFVLLFLVCAFAEEAQELSPGQKFFFETVAARRSVRSFRADAVSDAHLAMILDAARRVLRIPERYEQVCITPIGVPSEWPKPPAKKELSEFIVYESFSEE